MTAIGSVEGEWHDDDVVVARIEGEVDSSNLPDIAERVRGLLTNRALALILDLSGTTYLDSAGINLVFIIGEELRGRQQQFLLVVPEGSPIARMLQITNVDKTFATFPTVEAALAAA
jgi:anti-sigma B factor antagonist